MSHVFASDSFIFNHTLLCLTLHYLSDTRQLYRCSCICFCEAKSFIHPFRTNNCRVRVRSLFRGNTRDNGRHCQDLYGASVFCSSVKTDMGAAGAVSRLYIANANKKDSGNYSCALANVAAATMVSVHVLNGMFSPPTYNFRIFSIRLSCTPKDEQGTRRTLFSEEFFIFSTQKIYECYLFPSPARSLTEKNK